MLRGGALAGVAVAVGFASAHWAAVRAPPVEALPAKAVVLSAIVRGVDVLPEGRRLVLAKVQLAPDQAPLQRLVRVRMKRGDMTPVEAGDAVDIRAVLRAPSSPAYPGAWDLQRDEYFAGIAGGGTALNPVVVRAHPGAVGWGGWVQGIRDAVQRRTLAALPGTRGAVAATLLTGNALAIPADDRAAFRDSGLAHLLAVAGLHIGIVMGLFMVTMRLALAAWPHAALHWPCKAIAAGTALLGGAAYLALTGAHVPILRSFAMASLVTLGIAVGRRALSLRGLSLAAVALVLIAPAEVVGVSFQMSFAAVLALIAGYEALRPLLSRLHGPGVGRRVASHVLMLVLTSLFAGSASAAYGAYHFGHVQLYFIAANVVAVPLTAFWVLPLGVAGLFLMPLGLEAWALQPMGWGIEAILWVARAVAGWPAATIATPPLPGWGLAVFSLGLAWLCLWRTRVRLAGVALMLAGLLSPLTTPLPDLLVSNDARLIALRGDQGWQLQSRPGASRFVRDAWVDHFAMAGPPALDCGSAGCRRGGMLLLRDQAQRAECEGVTLVVAAEPARGVCRGVALLDRFTVWRDGAHAVWLAEDGPVVLSDRAWRGTRPWVPGPPVPARRLPNLPMAPMEVLPNETENGG
jgi:competence protein ComEC